MMDVQQYRTALAVTLAVALSWTLFVLPLEAVSAADLPSPLSGPGGESIKKSQQKKIRRAWQELTSGNLEASRKRLARLGQLPPAALLELQIRLVEGREDVTAELIAFCARNPDYAAAWITLSIAAEAEGSEQVALKAARLAGELWPTSPWANRATELEQRWLLHRITEAERLLEAGDLDGALSELEAVNALDPQRLDSTLLKAEILFADDRSQEALDLLEEIPDDPDARFLAGRIFESRQDWQTAMDSYSSLPEDYPERSSALQRAQISWRLTLLPAYAREAMAADQITRGDLAVILVSIRPQLETLQGGPVPVMSDIVDHPGQREIITVVRLGIVMADRRGHRFYPNRIADTETIRGVIERTRLVLGLPTPVWCTETDMVGSACIAMPSPTSGGSIVNAMLDVTSGAGP